MKNIVNVANSIACILDNEDNCFIIDRIDIQYNTILKQYIGYVDFRNVKADGSSSPRFVIYDDGTFIRFNKRRI